MIQRLNSFWSKSGVLKVFVGCLAEPSSTRPIQHQMNTSTSHEKTGDIRLPLLKNGLSFHGSRMKTQAKNSAVDSRMR